MVRRARGRGEEGVSTVEVVLLAPIMILLIMVLVGVGIYVDDIGQVEGASQDAARMISVQELGAPGESGVTAQMQTSAISAVSADVGSLCGQVDASNVTYGNAPVQGTGSLSTYMQVTVNCTFQIFGQSYTVTRSSYVPIDKYRVQP